MKCAPGVPAGVTGIADDQPAGRWESGGGCQGPGSTLSNRTACRSEQYSAGDRL